MNCGIWQIVKQLCGHQHSRSRSGETAPAEWAGCSRNAIAVLWWHTWQWRGVGASSSRTNFLTGMHCFKSAADRFSWRCMKSNTPKGCIRKLRQLTCCLAALSGNDFKGSVFERRHLIKQILDRLLRQRNGLMIYNKIERVLVITKLIFNHYNTDFSLEISSKVQMLVRNIHLHTNWPPNAKAVKDTSMLPSKIDQMKASHETGCEANFGFGHALMPSYLEMRPPKAAFFSFRMQPRRDRKEA